MTPNEFTAEIFETQRTAIKNKGGVHLSVELNLQDGKKKSFDAVDGKFDGVLEIGANGVSFYNHGEENPTPEISADKNIYTKPHTLYVIPFSEIKSYCINYDTVRKEYVANRDVQPTTE